MKTEVLEIDKENLEKMDIVKEIISSGDLVAFPTETVYGLGADGLNPKAVKKIFEAKGRPQDNPLILHVSSVEMLERLVVEVSDTARALIKEFWPGPLTIIFEKSDVVPDVITAGLKTVAIRMPKNEIALELIRISDTPIAAPSANISGRPSPTDGKTTYEDLKGKIPLIIDGGNTEVGLESTVLDLTSTPAMVLRPGAITLEMLEKIIPDVTLDRSILKKGEIPKSPGQKYKHYAPKANCHLALGDVKTKTLLMKEYISNNDEKIGVMGTDEFIKDLNFENIDIKSMGSINDLEEVGSKIFRLLRDFDRDGVDTILIEGVEEKGLGLAIMNRLKKSCGNKFLNEELKNENSSR